MYTMTILRKFIDRIVYEPDFFVKARIVSYIITIIIFIGLIL